MCIRDRDYSAAGAVAAGNLWGTGTANMGIGDSNYSIGLDCFNGYIDEVHTSSNARYESDFTPPTTQGRPGQYTLSYDNFDTPVAGTSGVIQYTGRSANTFTGCVQYRGDNQISEGAEIVPFTID